MNIATNPSNVQAKDTTPLSTELPILERHWPGVSEALDARQRHQRLVEHLHDLGPRPVGELLAELAQVHGISEDVDRRLERYGQLRADVVQALGVDRYLAPPLHIVEGGGR